MDYVSLTSKISSVLLSSSLKFTLSFYLTAFSLAQTLSSSGMYTLTVTSLVSVPYLFFTTMLYFPESCVDTVEMEKLTFFPDSNFRMQLASDTNDFSFFSHETSGVGSPQTVQERLSAYRKSTKELWVSKYLLCFLMPDSKYSSSPFSFLLLVKGCIPSWVINNLCHSSLS